MVIGIIKPSLMTSHDLINKLRRITGIKRVGHAGTLDPLATGVMVVGITRKGTRELNLYLGQEKKYRTLVRLDGTSDTDDSLGKIKVIRMERGPTIKEVKKVISSFIGELKQKPPNYSAIKVKGKPAYKWSRQGVELDLKSRVVELRDAKVVSYNWPELTLELVTGKGFYVRALARDIGFKLGAGGYLTNLERVRVGEFTKKRCFELEEFESWWDDWRASQGIKEK